MAFDRSVIKDKAIIVNGKAVLVKNATDKQLRSAVLANPRILKNAYMVRNGKIQRNPKVDLPNTEKGAYLTDAEYISKMAELRYDYNKAKRDYMEAMGGKGSRGKIAQDYEDAINALTRETRGGISSANANIGASNLVGSGVARRQLEDIGAEFFAGRGKLDTDAERMRREATKAMQESTTLFNQADLGQRLQAAFRWRELNRGVTPKKPSPPKAPAKTKAPAGYAYKKNPVTNKYQLVKINRG